MIKACIFDLDGTLTATLESIARPVNRTLRHFGLPEMPVDNFKIYVGNGLKTALQRALYDAGDPNGIHLEEGYPLCRDWFEADPLYHVAPYPNIQEMLDTLKTRGIHLAVCSNKLHSGAISVVETIFGKGTFEAIQGQTDLVPLKPDPAGVRSIMERLCVAPSECLYFGDTGTDMDTAGNAGIRAIGVTWGFRSREELLSHGAARLIDDPLEILDLLDD